MKHTVHHERFMEGIISKRVLIFNHLLEVMPPNLFFASAGCFGTAFYRDAEGNDHHAAQQTPPD
ncbi:hypothetical protein [Novacetimonas hansenii]|uniref:hypothetical protein n=1 Tax=Novacetimonas hansenii TaxID=436 RepID=UPI001115188C|nr:hypothetical protein [Novacetimonas hansenii]